MIGLQLRLERPGAQEFWIVWLSEQISASGLQLAVDMGGGNASAAP